MQQRESAKKAAASAAAANVAGRGSSAMVQGVPVALLGAGAEGASDIRLQQTAVTQAASWLDRANAILKGSLSQDDSLRKDSHAGSPSYKDESTQSSGDDSLEKQMKEVQRLISEGPVIQQATAGLPTLLTIAAPDHGRSYDSMATGQPTTAATSVSGPVSPDLEPADKRMRTSASTSTTGAEDAEALVGFLRSVRASAASGHDL
jgi:hypothetical protein